MSMLSVCSPKRFLWLELGCGYLHHWEMRSLRRLKSSVMLGVYSEFVLMSRGKEYQGQQHTLCHKAQAYGDHDEIIALEHGLQEQRGQARPGQDHHVHGRQAISESTQHCQQAGQGRTVQQYGADPQQGFCADVGNIGREPVGHLDPDVFKIVIFHGLDKRCVFQFG